MTDSANWDGADRVPRPDPTRLTIDAVNAVTDQYRRELFALRELLDVRIDNLGMLLDERYATQTKALDAAFVAAEKATATALTSAEKAVGVAAASNEARFQSVNEFRKTLSDQAQNFLPRQEYATAHQALEDKVATNVNAIAAMTPTIVPRNETEAWRQALIAKIDDATKTLNDRVGALELRLTSRLDLTAGTASGEHGQRTESLAVRGQLSQTVIMIVMSLAVVVSIVSVIAFIVKK